MSGATVTQGIDARYDEEAPGPYCLSHRSVFCSHVQDIIAERADTDLLAEVIGGNIGDRFYISFPIYPRYCLWETLSYMGVNHEALGPMAEVASTSKNHRVVNRLLPGESAADLAMSLRDNFEAEVTDKVNDLLKAERRPATPAKLPRCKNPNHSMRYQRLLNDMTEPRMLNENWEDLHDQTHALMWTWHYKSQCLFCYTKSAMADAIRVSPDFAVDPAGEPDNHDDLIPTAADTNRRRGPAPTDPPWV